MGNFAYERTCLTISRCKSLLKGFTFVFKTFVELWICVPQYFLKSSWTERWKYHFFHFRIYCKWFIREIRKRYFLSIHHINTLWQLCDLILPSFPKTQKCTHIRNDNTLRDFACVPKSIILILRQQGDCEIVMSNCCNLEWICEK